jgi:hypothetical protein
MSDQPDLTRIYTDSIRADFSDFIEFLNNPEEVPDLNKDQFLDELFSAYDSICDTTLVEVNKAISKERDDRRNDTSVEASTKDNLGVAIGKIRADLVYAKATKLYEDLHIPERYRTIFINSIAYCLHCRVRLVQDPMNHQIRTGVRGVEVIVEHIKAEM